MSLPFAEIHLKLINMSALDWTSALADLNARFPEDSIVRNLQARVHTFLDLSRILLPMTDVAIASRHWQILFAALGKTWVCTHNSNLSALCAYSLCCVSAPSACHICIPTFRSLCSILKFVSCNLSQTSVFLPLTGWQVMIMMKRSSSIFEILRSSALRSTASLSFYSGSTASSSTAPSKNPRPVCHLDRIAYTAAFRASDHILFRRLGDG